MKLHPDLREFIELLNSRRVDYLVVGGHAVAFHGFPRFTGDLDFFVRPSPANARRVVGVLSDFGFRESGLDESKLTRADQVIQLGHPPNRIDLLTSISGVTYDEAEEQSVAAKLDGLAVRFIGKESLVKNKRAAARPQDLADVARLTAEKPRRS